MRIARYVSPIALTFSVLLMACGPVAAPPSSPVIPSTQPFSTETLPTPDATSEPHTYTIQDALIPPEQRAGLPGNWPQACGTRYPIDLNNIPYTRERRNLPLLWIFTINFQVVDSLSGGPFGCLILFQGTLAEGESPYTYAPIGAYITPPCAVGENVTIAEGVAHFPAATAHGSIKCAMNLTQWVADIILDLPDSTARPDSILREFVTSGPFNSYPHLTFMALLKVDKAMEGSSTPGPVLQYHAGDGDSPLELSADIRWSIDRKKVEFDASSCALSTEEDKSNLIFVDRTGNQEYRYAYVDTPQGGPALTPPPNCSSSAVDRTDQPMTIDGAVLEIGSASFKGAIDEAIIDPLESKGGLNTVTTDKSSSGQ